MLDVGDLRASYGPVQVVRGVSFSVAGGAVTAIVGPNGAGKTTLAHALAGLHRAKQGSIQLGGRELSKAGTVEVARAGLTLVPQGRRLFPSLTVREHVKLARRHHRPRAMAVDELLELFPQLERRMDVRAHSLSGGEQQMLAIGRAVLLGPDLLVLDEPTEGLAPAVVDLVVGLIDHLRRQDVGVLLFEQSGRFPFDVADTVLGIDRGVIGGEVERPGGARTAAPAKVGG